MKAALLIISFFLLIASAHAGLAYDLGKGIKKGKVQLEKVKANDWLLEKEAMLESKYDFSENVSYVFEDSDEIIETCGFDFDTDYDDLSAEEGHFVRWNKAVKTVRGKKKSFAYVAFLIVPVAGPKNGRKVECEVVRGQYAIDSKGKDATSYLSVDLENNMQK